MKLLIDIGHPAHVHLFRYFAKEMLQRNHKILFTCRDKEFEIDLLKKFNFDYINFGKNTHPDLVNFLDSLNSV
jgi:uncharacterized protein